jgi:hypothetical protein
MYRTRVSVVLWALVFTSSLSGIASVPAFAQDGTKPGAKQKNEPSKTNPATMTGCVDEQEGHYILIDDRTRDPIANLEAQGFETEGFAKHVGHKVTVRGTSSPGETRPTFRVRSIETVSDTCGAQLH